MTLIASHTYNALKSVGVTDDLAVKAAEEVTNFNDRIASLKTNLAVLQWMAGFNLAISVVILFKVFH